MASQTQYSAVPYLYKSVGLVAREEIDRCPPYSYLDNLNMLERDEESLSSRYGTTIINRDPDGTTGGVNYYFTSPVTTISRLNYQSSAWRYAGLQDGTLYRRFGDSQGPYTSIDTGLSGEYFGSIVYNTFQSSQAWLFIYDANVSIKDNGTLTNPYLTGIDPPAYTANTLPYSPLLTMIDNFATTNTYTASNVSGWAYGLITDLTPSSGQTVTDFSEFFGFPTSGGGGGTTVASTPTSDTKVAAAGSGFPTDVQTSTFSFASSDIASSITVILSSQIVFDGTIAPGNMVEINISTDSGATYTNVFTFSGAAPGTPSAFPISGYVNLATCMIQVVTTAVWDGVALDGITITTDVASVTGNVGGGSGSTTDPFAGIVNGMLSILESATAFPTGVAIVAAQSTTAVAGGYSSLLVATSTAHGYSAGSFISIYGSSANLVDGFYEVVSAPTATTFTVAYFSSVYLNATGGITYGGATQPTTCVLTNRYFTPYPAQLSAWGFYQQVLTTTTSFPVSNWSGTVAASTAGSVGKTVALDLSIGNQVTDDDLIVLTLKVGSPANISNIRLQFDVAGSNYTSSYYYKDISPAYYQGNIANTILAYQATENQILADTLGLITGAPPNSTTAQLQPGNFSTGSGTWATVYLRRGDFLPVGSAGQQGLDWSAISGWQVVFTTNATGSSTVAMNGLYLQWGYGPSSFGGVGYDYRYTYYCALTGTESNGSELQAYNDQFGWLPSLTAPIFLRQAAQITGIYSSDPQVTHVRVYRRGGTFAANWYQVGQFPNVFSGGEFFFKDVISDAVLSQANTLVLDNDPPVTSSLVNPIATSLMSAPASPGQTIYSIFLPQALNVADTTAVFVPEQIVDVGYANNLEQVRVITGGTGYFTAILRLQHNAGEPVNVYSIPRQPCNLCALAYGQIWLAGDPNNPNYLYFSKKGYPENFGPQNYIPVSTSDDPIMAVINWRGTLIVGTMKSWFIIVGGSQPYAQSTGSQHGIVSSSGWTIIESGIQYRAADGLRVFTGAEGVYKTLPVEWLYRNNPQAIPPLVDMNYAAYDVMAYYNNVCFTSYVSQNNEVTELISGGDTAATSTDGMPATATSIYSGFSSLAANGPATLSVPILSGGISYVGASSGVGTVTLSYSTNAGVTWTPFWSWTGGSFDRTITPTTATVPVTVANLSTLQVRNVSTATSGAHNITICGALLGPISVKTGGTRYRLNYDLLYSRFRYDDIPATAMLWEKDTNAFLVGKQISLGNYAIVQDQITTQDYDDGGWSSGALVKTPVALQWQMPYYDQGKPHNPKQYNMLETDVNTHNQVMDTELLFNTEPPTSVTLATANTGTERQKVQLNVEGGDGYQAYSASIRHTMSVITAPIIYQENIYAAVLAANRSSLDSYWLKLGEDTSFFVKQGYFDYTSTQDVTVNLYRDGSSTLYHTFDLPAMPNRWVERVRFPALLMREFRMIILGAVGTAPALSSPIQIWAAPRLEWKTAKSSGGGYQIYEVVS